MDISKLAGAARGDYAANVGSQPCNEIYPGPSSFADGDSSTYAWPDTSNHNGISYQRSMVRSAMVTDGTSNTYLVGERYLMPDSYTTGWDAADNSNLFTGYENDNYRDAAGVPVQDCRTQIPPQHHPGCPKRHASAAIPGDSTRRCPNVLIVLIDDMGFGQSSAFGGPINMPTVDRLANSGLRYNAFQTCALCSPTRAAILTGRNHHTANTGSVMETATAFPGNTGQRPASVAPLAKTLRYNGYATARPWKKS